MSQLHLMGLSNGGQASNQALISFDKKFKTITLLSTPCYQIKHSSTKVLLIDNLLCVQRGTQYSNNDTIWFEIAYGSEYVYIGYGYLERINFEELLDVAYFPKNKITWYQCYYL